jgi:protein phosphatase
VKLRFAAVTDVGSVRPQNEDQILVDEPLFAVADGMGGHAAGEVAAEIAVETLRAAFKADPTPAGLVEGFRRADVAVWQRSQDEPDTRGMGTTLTAAALVDEDGEQVIELANVGDSRAYILRDGDLEQLTVDHSLVSDLVQAGRLRPEDAMDHPQRHIVTRSIGVDFHGDGAIDLDVDSFTVVPYKGDRFLLSSDGLSDMVIDDQIASVLRRFADPNDAAKELVRIAKAAGGNDNISVIVIDVVDDDDKSATASKALANEPAPPAAASARIREPQRDEDPRRTTQAVPTQPARPPRTRAARQAMTVRTVGFVIAVLAIIGLAVVAITWYAKGSYYVGARRGNVAIFRGRPGGFLWVKPTLKERTDLKLADVPPSRRERVTEGQAEPTLRAARHYITNLRSEAAALAATTTTTAAPTTTIVTPTTAAP